MMDVELRSLKLHVDGKDFEAVLSIPQKEKPEYGVVLTHGAGGSLDSGELPPLTQYLATHGVLCLRFTCRGLNLKYRIRVYQQIVEQFLSLEEFKLKGVFLGGRSMGSRAAVGVVNGSTENLLHKHIMGVICLAYPLIGSNKGDIRDEPLFELTVPCIFISGDRDPMCPINKLEETQKIMKCEKTICWLPGVAHQFTVTGKQGETIDTICHQVNKWCFSLTKMAENFQDKAASKYDLKIHDKDNSNRQSKTHNSNNKDKNKMSPKRRPKADLKRKCQGVVSDDHCSSSGKVSEKIVKSKIRQSKISKLIS